MNSTSRPKVLVVDDNDLMRTLLRGMLRESDYDVIGEARNGVAALELTERLQPDIICMDLVMPEMNGVEALQAIKARHPDVIVVMITGSPSVDNVRESIRNGASGFIIKPFNAGKLLDTIDRAWQSTRREFNGQARV
ncbi:MAG: response regulator [Candidatus Accumulibacter sp.]|jgi:two-component system chemotaxis response regulator CheY|uniref:response regulator transcription factor n=1 Tax=Accumulibacter sp. TaxID=2053492 RepID=UPI001A4A80D0|nr:response regulator [Accumulibacter sp.]MBL8396107.1 response regulator [Accumulibacter sp.]